MFSSGTAAVVGSKPLTRGWQHYWEVKFCSPVYGTDMMVGLATSKLDLASHQHSFASFLGHDSHSWGYSYHGSTQHAGIANSKPTVSSFPDFSLKRPRLWLGPVTGPGKVRNPFPSP